MEQVRQGFRQPSTPAGYPTMPGYQVGQQSMPTAQTSDRPTAWMPAQSTQPAPVSPGYIPMTMDDVLVKTGLCFAVLLVGAAIGWFLPVLAPGLTGIALVGCPLIALVAVLVASFKRQPSPGLTLSYAVFEGLFLGIFSRFMETALPGVVVQALLGTAAIFLSCLVLFKTGLVRANATFVKVTLAGLIGIMIYSVFALGYSLFTGTNLNSVTLYGIPLGLLVGAAAVILGAMSLIMDFDIAREGVRHGVPREMAWSCALGMMVTVVWLYIELLRILSYLRSE